MATNIVARGRATSAPAEFDLEFAFANNTKCNELKKILAQLALYNERVCGRTEHPTAGWTAQQLVVAFPFDEAPLSGSPASPAEDLSNGARIGLSMETHRIRGPFIKRNPRELPNCRRFMGFITITCPRLREFSGRTTLPPRGCGRSRSNCVLRRGYAPGTYPVPRKHRTATGIGDSLKSNLQSKRRSSNTNQGARNPHGRFAQVRTPGKFTVSGIPFVGGKHEEDSRQTGAGRLCSRGVDTGVCAARGNLEQRLQDVPISVTAVTGDAISDRE
jgi:hypothetical protein